MNPNPVNPVTDPEVQAQRDELHGESRLFQCFIYVCLLGIVVWEFLASLPARVWRWLNWRRQCSWCNRRMGGNPLAYAVTHGICKSCEEKWLTELENKLPELPPVGTLSTASQTSPQ